MSLDQVDKEKIYCPKSIGELEQIIGSNKNKLTFVAGATDLMVQNAEWKSKKNIVDLTSIRELSNDILTAENGIRIGAAIPMSDMINHYVLREKCPILVEALKQIGSIQIQNRATLGGNIANASPAGDSLPILNVLGAQLWIGPRINGEFEKLSLDQVMIGPGETTLKNNRYIAYIYIPFYENEDQFWYFRKVGQREALAISKLSLAVLGWYKNGKISDIKISAGAVSAQVTRAKKTEKVLNENNLNEKIIDEARQVLESEIAPITDIRSNVQYRKHICGELLRECLYQLMMEKK